jgi:hypothetical protein
LAAACQSLIGYRSTLLDVGSVVAILSSPERRPARKVYPVKHLNAFIFSSGVAPFLLVGAAIGDSVQVPPVSVGVPNVLTLGCDPSGARDSAPCVQAAMKNCGTWYFPGGNYKISTTVVAPTNICAWHLIGSQGNSSFIISAPVGFRIGTLNSTHSYVGGVMDGFHVDGNNRGQNTTAFQVYGVTNIRWIHMYIQQIKGEAFHAEQSWDNEIASSFIQYSGDNVTTPSGRNLCAINLYWSGTGDYNNHWDIHDNLIEAEYYSSLCGNGALNEDDHFIHNNKFGNNNYISKTPADLGLFLIRFNNTTGISIDDNWFFTGGMIYARNTSSIAIKGNHGRLLQQGIWLDGDRTASPLVYGNHIEGDNIASITGGRYCIRYDGFFGQIGPTNDCQKWNVDYLIDAAAHNSRILWPADAGAPSAKVTNKSGGANAVVVVPMP